jgi:hypothetical protein
MPIPLRCGIEIGERAVPITNEVQPVLLARELLTELLERLLVPQSLLHRCVVVIC